jgi:hypothetical protein
MRYASSPSSPHKSVQGPNPFDRMETNPSSVAMSDLWAFLCSKTLGLFSAQFAKISSRLEIHSRFIRMENAFFCHANECRRLPWASFPSQQAT